MRPMFKMIGTCTCHAVSSPRIMLFKSQWVPLRSTLNMVDIQDRLLTLCLNHFVEPSETFAADMQAALERAQACLRIAQDCLRIAQSRQTRYANQKRRDLEFEVGEFVLFDSKNLKVKIEGARKLGHRFIGPYRILWRIGPVSYELEVTQDMKMRDVFHISLLRRGKKMPKEHPLH